MKKLLQLSALLLGIIFSGDALAQQAGGVKIGTVDTEVIFKQLPETAEAESKLGDVMKRYRDTLESMQSDFQSKLEAYKKQEAMLTADGKRQKEEELRVLQQRYMMYQEEKFSATGEVARVREQLLAPMRKKVQDAISAVAKEEKLNFVFDKFNSAMLYSDEKAEITFRVLDRIKRGSK